MVTLVTPLEIYSRKIHPSFLNYIFLGFRHVFHPTGCHELLHELSVFFFPMVSDAEVSASLCSFWICIFERNRNSWPDVCTLFVSSWSLFGATFALIFPILLFNLVKMSLFCLCFYHCTFLSDFISAHSCTCSVGFVRTAWGQGEP